MYVGGVVEEFDVGNFEGEVGVVFLVDVGCCFVVDGDEVERGVGVFVVCWDKGVVIVLINMFYERLESRIRYILVINW